MHVAPRERAVVADSLAVAAPEARRQTPPSPLSPRLFSIPPTVSGRAGLYSGALQLSIRALPQPALTRMLNMFAYFKEDFSFFPLFPSLDSFSFLPPGLRVDIF